jgi:hypothetical protein
MNEGFLMASNFWIKLYHEILHDPKMGRLPDNVWRRAIELFLLAGELDEDGKLPNTEDTAWLLHRAGVEEFEAELCHLEKVGILTRLEDGWLVTKFSERQKAIGDAERAKAYRDRKRRQIEPEPQESNELDTPESQERHEPVTNRDVDIDIDKEILSKDNSGKPPQKVEKVSRENIVDNKTLMADTPESRLLFAKIDRNRAGKGYKPLKRFGSLEQKQKCLTAATRLGHKGFVEGVEAGLANGITDLKGLVNWIAKWGLVSQNGAKPHSSAPASPRASPAYKSPEEEIAAFRAKQKGQASV